jgi:hypothetical protein
MRTLRLHSALFGAALLLAPLSAGARPSAVAERYRRALDKLEPITRGADLPRQNQGAHGRINAVLGETHLSEEPPLVQPPISGPWHY